MNGDTKKAFSMPAVNGPADVAPPSTGPERVQVPLTERVVHLDHHDPQHAVAVPAEEEAGRVEHVSQHAQVGHQRHAPAVRILAPGTQVGADLGGDVRGWDGQVVGVTEDGSGSAVVAEQPQVAIEVVELVQVQGGVPDVVLQAVGERARSGGGGPCPRAGGTSRRSLRRAQAEPLGHATPPDHLGRLEARATAVLVEAIAEVRPGEPRPPAALEGLDTILGIAASRTCTSGG